MFRILRVTGNSLHPDIQEGDFVLLATGSLFLNHLREGDTVIFKHKTHGTLIKRIKRIVGDDIHVTGMHENSLDSRRLGPIPRQAVEGKMLWHIRKAR